MRRRHRTARTSDERGWHRLLPIVGWSVSCALVTAITLAAVERASNEVSQTPPISSQEHVAAQASAAIAAAQSASASASLAPPPPTGNPTPGPSRPAPQPTPDTVPTPSPSPESSAPSRPPAPPSDTPSPVEGSPAPSSVSPTPTVPTGKQTFLVPGQANWYAQVTVVCVGDSVYSGQQGNGYKVVLSPASGYTFTPELITTGRGVALAVTFTDPNGQTSRYLFACRAGEPLDPVLISPSPSPSPSASTAQ